LPNAPQVLLSAKEDFPQVPKARFPTILTKIVAKDTRLFRDVGMTAEIAGRAYYWPSFSLLETLTSHQSHTYFPASSHPRELERYWYSRKVAVWAEREFYELSEMK
jgi:hypothetical protein